MNNEYIDSHNISQGIASYVDYLNNLRLTELIETLESILQTETGLLIDLDDRFISSMTHLDLASMQIDYFIQSNRGGSLGLHGFIAESAEVGIVNSQRAFEGLKETAILLNNNGKADIIIENSPLQLKFYNDIQNELKQSAFYRDMSMMIPKNHFEVIEKIMAGEKEIYYNENKLSISKIKKIRNIITQEESIRGISWKDFIKPSHLNYNDVQKNQIHQTIASEKSQLEAKAKIEEQKIKSKAKTNRLNARENSKASFSEASKVAGVGATLQGSVNFLTFIYKKHSEGKDIWQFDQNDWKESGIETGKGAIKGGVTGYSIYGLTNVCQLSAPSAGAITSGTFGIASAIIKYRSNEIDDDEFVDLITLNALDATGAAIGAAIGQTIIPIPVLGALIGSLTVSSALKIGEGLFDKHEEKLISIYKEKIDKYTRELDTELFEQLTNMYEKYNELGNIQEFSFDLSLNIRLRLSTSIDFAKIVGVEDENILHNTTEIDQYFID